MKKILLILLFGCFFSNLNAAGNMRHYGCGTDMILLNFGNTAKAGGNPDLQKFFEGFTCKPLGNKKPLSTILTNINFETGDFQCEYALEQEITEEEIADMVKEGKIQAGHIQNSNLAINSKNHACLNFDEDVKSTDNYNIFANASILPTPPLAPSTGNYDASTYIGIFPVSNIRTNFWYGNSTVNKIDVNFSEQVRQIGLIKQAEKDTKLTSVTKRTIDTVGTNSKNKTFTISEYLTGVITLDPDIFDTSNGEILNSKGEIFLKAKNSFVNAIPTDSISWIPDALQPTRDIKVNDPLSSIIDGQFWGFYVSFIENLKLAEHKIILMLFGFGFFGLVGQKLIFSAYSHFGDNQEKHNNLGISKMIISPVASLIFFTAPIVPSNLNIPNAYIKETTNFTTGIILNKGNSNNNQSVMDEVGNSTIIQVAIRYFAKWGNLTANELADYTLYPYLNYLEMRQGAVFGTLADTYTNLLKLTFIEFKRLERATMFYEGFCKPIYKGSNEIEDVFLASPMIGRQPLVLNELTKKSFGKFSGVSKFGFDTVSAQLCADLETQIGIQSQTAFANYASLTEGLNKTYKLLNLYYNDYTGQVQASGFKSSAKDEMVSNKTITNRMVTMQEHSGWIFSAIVPVSYVLMQSASVAETIKEKQDAAKKYAANSGLRHNRILSSKVDDNIGRQDLSTSQKIAETIIPNAAYFMLPKFGELFQALCKLLEPMTDVLDTVVSLVSSFSVLLAFPLGKILGGIILPMIYTVIKAALYFVIYLLAITLYNVFLKIITLTVVMSMAIYKIAMYFLELLVFFVMSPAVVIWAVVSKKSEVIWHYIGKGAVLTITPILIVLSCYLFIFSSETLTVVYSYLSGLISGIFVTGETSFMTNVTVYTIVSIGNGIILMSNLFIGYITIIKASHWFLETVGAKASVIDNFSGEIGQKTEKYIGVV